MKNVYLVDENGKRPAGAGEGDYIVTGGGTYQIVNGVGKLIDGLTSKTTSRAEVIKNYENLSSSPGYKGRSANYVRPAAIDADFTGRTDETPAAAGAAVYVSGYDPTEYAVSGSAGSSAGSGASLIVGYVTVGLVLIALLDRFIGGK